MDIAMIRSGQVRSHYILFSRTRLIGCLTLRQVNLRRKDVRQAQAILHAACMLRSVMACSGSSLDRLLPLSSMHCRVSTFAGHGRR